MWSRSLRLSAAPIAAAVRRGPTLAASPSPKRHFNGGRILRNGQAILDGAAGTTTTASSGGVCESQDSADSPPRRTDQTVPRAAADDLSSVDLSALLSRIDDLEARINDLTRLAQPSFRAGQFNILASYLGSNTEPWFLYGGLTDSREDLKRADAIGRKHQQRDADGNFMNVGWPNYVRGILTEGEIAEVERRHAESFAWEVRSPKILDNIREMDADVLSLVELDRYDTYFKPALEGMGYDSLWTKRPRSSSADGCTVCWRRSKFELEASRSFEYSDDVGGTKKDRVALMALLRMKHSPDNKDPTRLIFVSTHLARNPECPHQEAVRLRQAAQLMLELKSFADEHGCGPGVPAVVAGDWNAESLNEIRSVTSAVFGLQAQQGGGGAVSGSSSGGGTTSASDSMPHPLLWGNMDVPTRPTSYTLLRRSRIDYLMYSETYLRLRRVSHLDDDDARDTDGRELRRTIPNERHPSDHLPIAADFQYPTELEVAQECARKFCAGLARGSGFVRPLPPAELLAAFEYFDHDSSGTVTAEDLDAGVIRLGAGVAADGCEGRRRLRKLCCTEAVLGKDGLVATADSFRRIFEDNFLVARSQLMTDESSPFMKDIANAFRYFDLDGNGVLSHEEISTTLRAISPVPIDDDAVKNIIEAIDENGDGSIQLEEFVLAMVKGHRGEERGSK